jgi:carbon-monoxide dehydrogenase small subunit
MQMTPGLGGREPNFQIRQSFTVPHPVARVWELFGDIGRVATCIPGASLTSEPRDGRVEGRFTAKVGPIRAAFNGVAQIEPDDATRTGRILAAGLDASGGSRAACEIAYELHAQSGDEAGERTTVNVVMGALLAGPLAQFGRSGIVEDLVAQITATFATNIAANLNGEATREAQPLEAGSLLTRVLLRRLRSFLQRLLRLGRD